MLQMGLWESNEYDILKSPLVASDLKLDDATQPINYLEWINWDHKHSSQDDYLVVPTSNSSDSGLSSDFNYEQQLSPCKFYTSIFTLNLNLYVTHLFLY